MKIESKLDLSKYLTNFKLVETAGGRAIAYKNTLLWRSMNNNIKELEFLVLGGDSCEEYTEPYCLACKDSHDDYYVWGRWNSLEEVINFLESEV